MDHNWTHSPHPVVDAGAHRIFNKLSPPYPKDLGTTLRMVANLGNPHLSTPPVFHVAGTNGKGSTLAFLQAMFEAGGLSVHKYTSPHLVRLEERFVLNGRMIDSDYLATLITECQQAATGTDASFFEILTGLMFLAAARVPADAFLLETGLGGALDATNIAPRSLGIITRISYDHMRVLGNDIASIAAAKAGIMRPGCPCIIAPQADATALKTLEDHAQKIGAPVFRAGHEWRLHRGEDDFIYESARHSFRLPKPALDGAHQMVNAATAIAALEYSDFAFLLKQDILETAMRTVRWPGRMQRLPIPGLPEGWEVWLDGAHNDSSAEVLAQRIAKWGDGKPVHLVTAMKKDKLQDSGAPGDFYGVLKPYIASVQVMDEAQITAPMIPAQELCDHLKKAGFPDVHIVPNLESSIRALTFQYREPQRILIAGSLYLAGSVLRHNTSDWKEHEAAHRACG